LGKKVWPNTQQDADLNVEKSVEPDAEVETTAIANKMRNLQGCEDIQKTDVIAWLATDDPAYCNTDLDDKIILILAVSRNAANKPEDTENSDSDTEEAFLKVTHSEGKEALKTALCYLQQQKESTPGDMLIKKWKDYAASKRRSSLQQRKVTEFSNKSEHFFYLRNVCK
jgi:hypothetical protein